MKGKFIIYALLVSFVSAAASWGNLLNSPSGSSTSGSGSSWSSNTGSGSWSSGGWHK